MKTKITLLIGMFLLFSNASQAEGTVANGGNALVCYKKADRKDIVSIQLFDYWEMDKTLKIPGGVQLGAANLPVTDKIKIFTDRVKKYDPILAQEISLIAQSMATNINKYLVTNQDLPAIADYTPIAIPSSPCFIEQFAVQWDKADDGRYRFSISDFLYRNPKATNDARAGIILHEAIYRNAILRKAKDSDGTRYFNYVVATNKMNASGLVDYTSLLDRTKLAIAPNCQFKKFETLNQNLYVTQMHNPGHYYLCLPQQLSFGIVKITLGSEGLTDHFISEYNNNDLEGKVGGYGSFQVTNAAGLTQTLNGYVEMETRQIENRRPFLRVNLDLFDVKIDPGLFLRTADNQVIDCPDTYFDLSIYGEGVLGCSPNKKILLKFQGLQFLTDGLHPITIDENHNLRSFTADKPIILRVESSSKSYSFANSVDIGPNGGVIYGYLEKPLKVFINGHPVDVRYIDLDLLTKKNKVYDSYNYSTAPMYQGRRILAKDNTSIAADKVCALFGYGDESSGFKNFEEKYISGVEEFYDPVENKFVYRSDEKANVMINMNCEGTYYFDL